MNIYQCQKWAEQNGYNTAKFVAEFPAGPKECTWLDAFFGLFYIEGVDSWVRVNDVNAHFPNLVCTLAEK